MPKIHLKPQSPEFADDAKPIRDRGCDMPGCAEDAAYRAPKDRGLREYYWFCFTHVSEYNKAWNYFEGMAPADIEDYIVRSGLWDRPTWKFSNFAEATEHIFRKAWQTYHNTDEEPPKGFQQEQVKQHHAPEFEAMAILGLEPPLDLQGIKLRYKELVKKHHPDVNGGSAESEELLKSINMAYTILKLSYEKYEKLPEREKES